MSIRSRCPSRWAGAIGVLPLAVASVALATALEAQPGATSAFLEYRRQLAEATSVDAVRTYLPPGTQKMLGYATERELVSWFDKYRQLRLQADIEIVGEEPIENAVRLRARAKHSVDGGPLLGRVDMRLEGGSWRVVEEIWYPDFRPAANRAEADADFATGTFSVAGNEVEMSHAYVELEAYWADDDLPGLQLTISDQPIDLDDFGLRQRSDAGELHYFVLTISPDQMVTGGMMYHQAYESGYISIVGVHHLETTRFGPTVIEGQVFTREPTEFAEITEYSVEFRATLLPEQ